MSKKTPRKPDRPIGAIIFPKSGPVRRELEHLPREQKPLELIIGQKFVGAITHFGHGILTDLRLGDEPADLLCTDASGHPVSIQVAEIVDEFGVKLNAHRDIYVRALKESCADMLAMLSGCALEILDDGTEDFFPPLNRPEGQAMFKELASHIATLAQEIDTLGVKKLRHRKCTIGASRTTVSFSCQRHMEAAPETGFTIRWGRQRVFKAEERNALLSDTIRNKIRKSYTPPNHEFWLLVYTTDMLFAADDASIGIAAALLDCSSHPFEKVWFFFPYHDRDFSQVVRVWARS